GPVHPDPLADPALIDFFADGVDHSGSVQVRGEFGEPHGAHVAGAGLPVGRVDSGDGDPDADLAGAGFGGVAVDEPQDFGAAVVAVDDGLHDLSSFPSVLMPWRSGESVLRPRPQPRRAFAPYGKE